MREFIESSDTELAGKLKECKTALYFLKVNAKTGQMEKTADIRNSKRHIARILTEINSRKAKLELKEAVK
ncbi:MAG: hypothetical protein ACD_37C00267G0004 [uncultured bacterium]|nr:MAG: hypothetical protein ACD_37C00267G0004 [uncultured bacterium]